MTETLVETEALQEKVIIPPALFGKFRPGTRVTESNLAGDILVLLDEIPMAGQRKLFVMKDADEGALILLSKGVIKLAAYQRNYSLKSENTKNTKNTKNTDNSGNSEKGKESEKGRKDEKSGIDIGRRAESKGRVFFQRQKGMAHFLVVKTRFGILLSCDNFL